MNKFWVIDNPNVLIWKGPANEKPKEVKKGKKEKEKGKA